MRRARRGVAASYDEVTEMLTRTPVRKRSRGASVASSWRMVDRSETGCRLHGAGRGGAGRSSARSLAIREGDAWSLGVVRRMQRDRGRRDVTVGVEIIGRAPGAGAAAYLGRAGEAGRPRPMRPFFGIYLPAHPDNRQMAQRSLIGPDDRFVSGGMVELDTGQRALPDPVHPDAGAAARLGVGAVLRGAQADALSETDCVIGTYGAASLPSRLGPPVSAIRSGNHAELG